MDLHLNENGTSSTASVEIPDPLATYVQVWPVAWYYLGSGAGITNEDMYNASTYTLFCGSV